MQNETNTQNMKTLATNNRTFNNKVKTLIAIELKKVARFQKLNNKEVRLINLKNETVAIWKQTFNGSEVILNSWY
tara:strand:- start:15051 stop:15275 length:225 start_codon:yes stop_codon:yes gene_type:complete